MAKHADSAPTQDPRTQGATPEFPQEPMAHPGSDEQLTPGADHGEASYRGADRLKDRVALITGGDSGIGRAVALAFAREGADIVISYLPEEERDAQETVRVLRDAGRRGVAMPGDIQDQTYCRELIQRAVNDLGRLDILVN